MLAALRVIIILKTYIIINKKKMKNDEIDYASAHDYRMQKINDMQHSLEGERDRRRELSSKCRRNLSWISNLDAILAAVSMIIEATGIGILSNTDNVMVVVGLQFASICLGVFGMVGKYMNKKLSLQAQKHDKISTIAEAKLNTISKLISKALDDDKISESEFAIILSEFDSFEKMKNDLRNKMSITKITGRGEELPTSIKNNSKEYFETLV